tara:strand:- start:40 stop:903 length:864 start_codon:yes stop_codon:yes gene_type:complete
MGRSPTAANSAGGEHQGRAPHDNAGHGLAVQSGPPTIENHHPHVLYNWPDVILKHWTTPMPSLMETQPMPARGSLQSEPASTNEDRHLLWIDGVGGFLLLTRQAITIGGPQAPDTDIQLLASLSRQHATIHRDDGGYLLEAHGPTRVNQRRVVEWTELPDGADITLGRTVQLSFHRPTVLSGSGRLRFQSDHRPTHSLDGVVLVADTCLLGPGRDCHIQCPEWEDSVILIHRGGDWLVRSPRLTLEVNGKKLRGEATIGDGQIVTGPDLRFHVETPSTRSSNRGDRR